MQTFDFSKSENKEDLSSTLFTEIRVMAANFNHLSNKVEEIYDSLKKITEWQVHLSSLSSQSISSAEKIKEIQEITNAHQQIISSLVEKENKREKIKDIIMRSWLYPFVVAVVIGAAWVIDLFYRLKIK